MDKIVGLVVAVLVAGMATAHWLNRLRADAPAPAEPPRVAAMVEPRPTVAGGRDSVVIPEDGRGHFLVNPTINGARIRALVDTGASVVVLSYEDATKVGVYPSGNDFVHPVSTANGTINAARVKLREIRLDRITVTDVEAMVMPAGRLSGTLMGMSFLRRLKSFQVANGNLVLTP